MDTTFDMKKVKPETLKGQATYNQCEGLAKTFSYGLKGKEWGESRSRIRACLLHESKHGNFLSKKLLIFSRRQSFLKFIKIK